MKTKGKKESNILAFSILSFIRLSPFPGLLFASIMPLESLLFTLVLQSSLLHLNFVLIFSLNTQVIVLCSSLFFTCT